MFKNNLLVAIRHFQKQKFSSLVNIAGLSIAIATCLFLLLFVFDEFQFDNFHQNKERIVRLLEQDRKTGDKDAIWPAVFFPRMISEVPEIEKGFRLYRDPRQLIDVRNQKFYEDIYFADKEILEILTFPLVRGNKATVLSEPFSVILTEEMAHKYFGNEDPVGKVLRVENKYDLKVTGILKNIPAHSHIKPSILVAISTLNTTQPYTMNGKEISSCLFYFQLKKNTTSSTVESKLNKLVEKTDGKETADRIKLVLEPLNEIYLYSSETKWDCADHGDIDIVKSFILIAILITVMACFNYTNLLTTLVKIREKELAIRKLLGAGRKTILKQFLFETTIFHTVSFAAALIIVELLMNEFNQITGKQLTFGLFLQWEIVISVFAILCITAMLSVLYPFFVAFKSDSLNRLKGSIYTSDFKLSKLTFGFRQIVTGIQFSITIALIIAAIVIYNQMSYTRNAKLGFNKEQLLAIENPWGEKMYERYKNFKNRIFQYPEVQSVSASENVPGNNITNFTYVRQAGKLVNENVLLGHIAIDYGLFKTWQAKIIEGRDFSEEISSDLDRAVIINQAAAKKLGLKNPVGSFLSGVNNAADNQQVIGVVENTHFKSFKEEVTPIIFYLRQWSSGNFVVRLKSSNMFSTIKSLENEWNNVAPDRPLLYSFVDESFDNLYTAENRTAKLIMIFCTLAILIALIGLLSLVTLISQMRRKEIGVRKVLGASVANIVQMMTREYLYLMLAANIVAAPIAYYFLNKWLERFVYRIEISVWAFIIAGIVAFIIGISAICYKIIRAAKANLVESLRYE